MAVMFRKITAVVAALASLALAGCVSSKITRELAPEFAQWAATQPALVDLKFSAALAGGIPTNNIDVVGDVHVGSVAEFFSAVDQLYARLAEMPDGDRLGLDLNVNADIEGTPFTWKGNNWEPGRNKELTAVFEPVATPEVRTVLMEDFSRGLRAEVYRDFQTRDEDAHAYRDTLLRHFDDVQPSGSIELIGFPLARPTFTDEEGASRRISPVLRLSEFPQGYAATAALADKVDAATPYAVWSVWSFEGFYHWDFYTEDEYSEEAMKQLRSLLSSPAAGAPVGVQIKGPDGRLGEAIVGAPMSEQPEDTGPWGDRMAKAFAG